MPFALTLKSLDPTRDAILSLWNQVSAFEDFPSMRALNYPPHITFAIYDSPAASEQLAIATLERVAKGRTTIELAFDRIRSFDGPPLILWADPEPKDTLLDIHDQIHSAIDPGLCRPHYRPGCWVPHCTLGARIAHARNPDALAFANAFRGGLRVFFDTVDCVRLEPPTIVAELHLRSALKQE
ncbi:MAG TPA: 2'-5' RNA ligase family protein [Bradyrhizobium sp.]|nr:2'-5' RNA ligase family protein [Bradyrhizobium sp.]